MHLGVLARISSDEGTALGVARQVRLGNEYATRIGATVVHVTSENNLSGYSEWAERRDLQDWTRRIAAGRIDRLWARDYHRIARNGDVLGRFLENLADNGVELVTGSRGEIVADLSKPGRIKIVIGALTAQEQQLRDTENAKLALADRARDGLRHGKRAFGWLDDGTAHPVEGPLVTEAVERFLSGDTLHRIARDWVERGVPSPTWKRQVDTKTGRAGEAGSRPWDYTGVRQMIRRASNAGLRVHCGEVIGKGAWDALVTEDQWRTVTAKLNSAKRTRPERYVLSGILRRPGDGEPLGGVVKSGRRVYRTNRGTPSIQIDADETERIVIGVVRTMLADITEMDIAAAYSGRKSAARVAYEALAAARAEREEITLLARAGKLKASDAAAMFTGADANIERAQRAIGDIGGDAAMTFDGVIGPSPERAWDTLSIDRRRALIDALLRIEVLPGRGGPNPMPTSERLVIAAKWAASEAS